jgi:integrase
MAHVSKRGLFWRVEIRRKGYKPVYRTFDSKQDANKWARLTESEMDAGLFVDRSAAERMLLSEALERYEREVVSAKRHPYQETRRIKRWLEHDLAYRTLANLRGSDFALYRDERRQQGRAENTIRLELQVVSHLYEIARKEWGMEGLPNPLRNIRKPSGSKSRDRRLVADEYEKIRNHLLSHDNKFALAAFELALETSLRQGTLFSLRWEWVDLDARLVRIPVEARGAENKGVPAVLPLSKHATATLKSIVPVDNTSNLVTKPEGKVLATTANSVVCIWKRAMKKLAIVDLRWHDLRHEATTRLFEKGLHPMEVASITGHRSMQMLKRYTHLKPESLLAKLDQSD